MGDDPRTRSSVVRHAAVVLLSLLAGCLSPAEPEAPPATCADDAACRTLCDLECTDTTDPGAFVAPPLGRAWTYSATGVYDVDRDLTVVVAEANSSGYLFAAREETSLVGTAIWGRPWYGPKDASLNSERLRLFEFPLADGKRWDLREDLNVTATAADIRIPGGTVPGFVMQGERESMKVRYEYAREVGYLVRFRSEFEGIVYEEIELTGVGRSADWVWFERGPGAFAGAAGDPAALLQVPEGFDVVVASAGGADGGRARLVPPPTAGPPWGHDADGAEAWIATILPAAAGPWVLAATAPPDAWSWIEAAAVRWVRAGDAGSGDRSVDLAQSGQMTGHVTRSAHAR